MTLPLSSEDSHTKGTGGRAPAGRGGDPPLLLPRELERVSWRNPARNSSTFNDAAA
jgi:hypothetical protein